VIAFRFLPIRSGRPGLVEAKIKRHGFDANIHSPRRLNRKAKKGHRFRWPFESMRLFGYSLDELFRIAPSSFLMSSGDNWGRFTLIVSLLRSPVKAKGGL
jgi:hypothetical protein